MFGRRRTTGYFNTETGEERASARQDRWVPLQDSDSTPLFNLLITLVVVVGLGLGGYFVVNTMVGSANYERCTNDLCTEVVRTDLDIRKSDAAVRQSNDTVRVLNAATETAAARQQAAEIAKAVLERPINIVVPNPPNTNIIRSDSRPRVNCVNCGPRAMAPTCGARGCGVNAAAPLPNGRCMAPANSPHAGQMGFIHPDGTCKGRPPAAAAVRYAYY